MLVKTDLRADDAVLHAIHVQFPVRPKPRASELLPAANLCWEHVEMRRGLRGRSWKAVPRDFVWFWRNGLTWLTPVGFGYYLPAWLSLACVDGDAREPLLSSLERYPAWIEQGIADERCDRLGRPQLSAIVRFLEFWAAHRDRLCLEGEWAQSAIENYWGPRLNAARTGA